jgi:hypothetical protein
MSCAPETITRVDVAISVTGTMTLGDLLVGLGTLALAGFTYWLGRSARQEGTQVANQVELERERLEREQQPWIVLAPDPDWAWGQGAGRYGGNIWMERFPVKNIGPGAALNVKGVLSWGPPSGVFVELLATSVGAGDREDLRVHWDAGQREDWRRVEGKLDYDDIHGGRWRTTFVIETKGQARSVQVTGMVRMPGTTRPGASVDDEARPGWPASPGAG